MRIRALAFLPAALMTTSGLGIAYMAWSAPRKLPGMIEEGVTHPVTPKMESDIAVRSRKPAPVLSLTSYDGKPVSVGKPSGKPTFIYFVKEGCPCSFDAEPLFNDLYDHLGRKVEFVSVTDAKPKGAKKWSTEMSVPYPVVSDPKAQSMKEFEAIASVYSALLDGEGRIIKMWPGYSKGILKQMNAEMAKAAGVAEKPFDTKYAPVEKASGCAFSWPD